MRTSVFTTARGIAAVTLLALSSFAVSATPIAAGAQATATTSAPADIQAIFDKPKYTAGVWGLRVLDGSKVIIDMNPQRQFYIGSVRKIFSVGQLLNAVGPNHTYDTPVYRTGAIDGNGVVHGNLIVVASGDLTMGGRTNPDGTIAVSNWGKPYARPALNGSPETSSSTIASSSRSSSATSSTFGRSSSTTTS
jgi:D-alanyl-D-alanine carboxypeptidase